MLKRVGFIDQLFNDERASVSVHDVGKLLHSLQKEFDLPTYEVVQIANRVLPGKPWRRILLQTKEDAK